MLIDIAFVRAVAVVGYLVVFLRKEQTQAESGKESKLIAGFKVAVNIEPLGAESINHVDGCKRLVHAPAKGLLLLDGSLSVVAGYFCVVAFDDVIVNVRSVPVAAGTVVLKKLNSMGFSRSSLPAAFIDVILQRRLLKV